MFLGAQITYILRFFLSRNIRIARDRVWDQTVASRGKTPDFFGPYVEEFSRPPQVKDKESWLEKAAGGSLGLFLIKRGRFCFSCSADRFFFFLTNMLTVFM